MIRLNIPNYIRQYLSARRRKGKLQLLIEALLMPVVSLWNTFYQYRIIKVYEANLTPQTLSLQEHLNNVFDNEFRRILLLHYDAEGVYFPLSTEGYEGVFISLENELTGVFIALDGEIESSISADFIVKMPLSVYKENMLTEIEKYKLPDKTYTIQYE